MRDDKRAFSLLFREESRISEVGNGLATEANVQRAQDDARILETLQRLARRKGPVAAALARAAKAFGEGRKLEDVTRDLSTMPDERLMANLTLELAAADQMIKAAPEADSRTEVLS